ncbi:unnamed protein product, partial [Ectocarpus sp. 12 AP-2014]
DPQALRDAGITKIERDHPAAITIPGAVDAFCQLSERYGRLGIDAVLAPAIKYFDEGVPIAPRVASDIKPATAALSDVAKRHFSQNGKAFQTGDSLKLPGQADVLRRIAKEGRAAFYEGEVADDMLSTLQNIGGTHTAADFAATQSTWGTPVSGAYRSRQLIEHPPNGQGAVAILLAGILNQFDIA